MQSQPHRGWSDAPPCVQREPFRTATTRSPLDLRRMPDSFGFTTDARQCRASRVPPTRQGAAPFDRLATTKRAAITDQLDAPSVRLMQVALVAAFTMAVDTPTLSVCLDEILTWAPGNNHYPLLVGLNADRVLHGLTHDPGSRGPSSDPFLQVTSLTSLTNPAEYCRILLALGCLRQYFLKSHCVTASAGLQWCGPLSSHLPYSLHGRLIG